MITLQVRLFSKVSLQPFVELPAKALELLCYLLLHRDRAHTREALATILWPETSAPLAQKYLRQTLWQLQTSLENPGEGQNFGGEFLLLLNPGWVRANPDAPYWIDVKIFEQAYVDCLDLPGHALHMRQAQALEEAIELYQGDLLETWYQDWCIYERERLQLIYLAMLDKLMGYCEAQGCYDRGILYGQRILRYDAAREVTYQQLMRLHYLAGNRTTALREYKRCTTALAREFGVQPAAQTVALYEQIQAGCLSPTKPSDERGQPTNTPPMHRPGDITQELAQLQTTLAAFQTHIQQELATILGLLEEQQQTRQQTSRETR